MQIRTNRGHHHPTHRAAQVRTKRIGVPIAAVAILLSLTVIGSDRGPRRANAEEPTAYEAFADQLSARSRAQKAEAIEWALTHRAPILCDNGRRTCELMALSDGRPVYYVTANVNAAAALQTDRVRDILPWNLDGDGLIVGVWDAAGVRKTHQEFQGPDGRPRVMIRNSFVTSAHSTHVAGTIGATGVVPSAQGMAPGVRIESYNWNDGTGTMTTRAARLPRQPNAIFLSNRSYGILAGWEYHATKALSGRIKPDIVAPGGGTTLSDDPTSRLIHDLDLRGIGPDGTTVYYPYILNPAEPTVPAKTGDNTRDNVEQVCLLTPSER